MKRARAGEPIPPGWAFDANGEPTTDPAGGAEGDDGAGGRLQGRRRGADGGDVRRLPRRRQSRPVRASPFSGPAGGPPGTGQFFLAFDPGADLGRRLRLAAGRWSPPPSTGGAHLAGCAQIRGARERAGARASTSTPRRSPRCARCRRERHRAEAAGDGHAAGAARRDASDAAQFSARADPAGGARALALAPRRASRSTTRASAMPSIRVETPGHAYSAWSPSRRRSTSTPHRPRHRAGLGYDFRALRRRSRRRRDRAASGQRPLAGGRALYGARSGAGARQQERPAVRDRRAALARGAQPDARGCGKVGYLLRTTAVYGNGKFGIADRGEFAGRPEFAGPFRAEMLTVWLIRAFTCRSRRSCRGAPQPRRGGAACAGVAPELRRRQRHRARHGAVPGAPSRADPPLVASRARRRSPGCAPARGEPRRAAFSPRSADFRARGARLAHATIRRRPPRIVALKADLRGCWREARRAACADAVCPGMRSIASPRRICRWRGRKLPSR